MIEVRDLSLLYGGFFGQCSDNGYLVISIAVNQRQPSLLFSLVFGELVLFVYSFIWSNFP